MSKILYLEENTVGRDFAVGDIHGEYESLESALIEANFDPSKDRLILVGDSVDRGRHSKRALEFLNRPYVYAVRGNHEDMFIQLYENGEPEEYILAIECQSNGMRWWLDVDLETRRLLIETFKRLPLVIEVQTSRGSVGVIHAEVPIGMNWQSFKESIENEDPKTTAYCLWGRTRISEMNDSGVEGVGRIFSGHTVQLGAVTKLGNVYFIDTGSVFRVIENVESAHLSMTAIAAKTTIITRPIDPNVTVHLVDEDEVLRTPFGQYVN